MQFDLCFLFLTLCMGSFLAWVVDRYARSSVEPFSRCDHCHHPLRWYENVPLLSYFFLLGRCRQCGGSIPWHLPLLELLGLLVGLSAWWRFYGDPLRVMMIGGVGWLLLLLAAFDCAYGLLPDEVTLPLAWGGLLSAALGYHTLSASASILGCAGGYVLLWVVANGYHCLRGAAGMGYGDLKLLAALGAWVGPSPLLTLVGCSSGLALGVIQLFRLLGEHRTQIVFGPFLAWVGWWALLYPDPWVTGVDLRWFFGGA